MPAVQLRLDFAGPANNRPAKARQAQGAGPVATPLWVVPAPTLTEVDVRALRREIRCGWRDNARCADADDPEVWFPDPDTGEQDLASARAECVRCPVRRSCLAEAILGDEQGLWGGLTRRQRRSAIDRLDAGPNTGERDWSGLIDGLLLRLTVASIPIVPAASAGRPSTPSGQRRAGRLASGSAA
jgi:hypothetical protein